MLKNVRIYLIFFIWIVPSAGALADSVRYCVDVISAINALDGFKLVDSVNNHGQVVGYYNAPETIYSYAAYWDRATGFKAFEWGATARGISDCGHIVSGEAIRIYDIQGNILHSFIPDFAISGGDINNYDQVAGSVDDRSTALPTHKACLWDATNGLQMLGTLGGDMSISEALNDLGHVVGVSQDASGHSKAFLWDAVEGMRNLGTVGQGPYDHSWAYNINNMDVVVGQSMVLSTGLEQAFIWDETRGMRDLGSLTSWTSTAYAINDSSWVVGDCWTTTQERPKIAFVWNETMGMMALDNMLTADYQGYQINEAYDINNQGQILAKGTYNDQDYFLLLTPVPEPLSLSLLALGGVALARRRKK